MRYRARKRGEAVPKVRGGPKLGYRQTQEHIAKRMRRGVVLEPVGTTPEVHRNATETPLRERTFVDMEASPEVEENGELERTEAKSAEPADKANWREKRLGAKVIWQCRGCGTWWPARHNVGCLHE